MSVKKYEPALRAAKPIQFVPADGLALRRAARLPEVARASRLAYLRGYARERGRDHG